MSLGVSINHFYHSKMVVNSAARHGFIRAGWYQPRDGISIFHEPWSGIPRDCQASSPYKQRSQLAWGPRNSKTASRGHTHPDLGREQTLSKINTIMKVTAAVQEVASTEPSEHHTNFSQQLPGVILHFRNPMCWHLQAIFSTEIPSYRKHSKMVSFPV